MQITRNTLPASGPITRANLNALSDIQVALEAEDIEDVAAEISDTLGNGIAGHNYFRNPDLSLWTAGATALSLAEGMRSKRADFWFARADYGAIGSGGSGSYATYSRETDSANQQFLYTAKLLGCSGCSGIDFGQELPARVAAGLYPYITLTLEIENQSGASMTPTVRVDACNSFENYEAVTNLVAQSVGTAIANGTRATREVTINLTSYASQIRNGVLVYVRFTGLNTGVKYVKVHAAKLEIGQEATERVVEREIRSEAEQDAEEATSSGLNYLANGNLSVWPLSTVTATEDLKNYAARDWWVLPSDGSTLTCARNTTVPDTKSLYSALLTGDAAVTGTVDFGQHIAPSVAAESRRELTFSAYIYNNTGGAITPLLRVDTNDASYGFSAQTNRVNQTLDPCADGAWTRVWYTFDASALTNWVNGGSLYLRLGAGTMDNNAKSVRVAQVRLEPGASVQTYVPDTAVEQQILALPGVSRGLRGSKLTATTLQVLAEELILRDAGGRAVRIQSGSFTIDISTTGANGLDTGAIGAGTWYYIWVISRGDQHAAVLSLSATSPTLPSGYLYRGLMGAIRTNGSSQIADGFRQFDRMVWIDDTVVLNDVTVTTADTYQSLDLSSAIPPNATAVWLNAGISSSGDDCRLVIGPTSTGLPEIAVTGAATTSGALGFKAGGLVRVPIVAASTIYWKSIVKGTTTYRMSVVGYEVP